MAVFLWELESLILLDVAAFANLIHPMWLRGLSSLAVPVAAQCSPSRHKLQ